MARNESAINLWEGDTEVADRDLWRRDIHLFSSPRIWGHYKIHRHASVNLNAKCDRMYEIEADRLKARLASVLIDLIDRGDTVPLVDAEMIERLIETSRPLAVSKRALRLLRFMTKPEFSIDKGLNLGFEEQLREAVLGWSESTNEREVDFFLNYLLEKELIKRDANLPGYFYPTVEGFEATESEIQTAASKDVFIAMWFNEKSAELRDLWSAIENAVTQSGYVAFRVDRHDFPGLIDDEIVAAIRRARFVIADFTHDSEGHRGSVYYEAGFARGLNKDVIQTARSDILEGGKIAFDLNHYPVLRWEPNSLDAFTEALQIRIEALFGEASNFLR